MKKILTIYTLSESSFPSWSNMLEPDHCFDQLVVQDNECKQMYDHFS